VIVIPGRPSCSIVVFLVEIEMNPMLWLLAGALVGWLGFKHIGANKSRGMMISIIIGVVGAFVGGNMLAPMLGETPSIPDGVSVFALVVAAASAAICLTISDMLSKRFDI
jgi:uncharacterized membrane protein YeaQ/YmgE (transglycosylase-associated protein family)